MSYLNLAMIALSNAASLLYYSRGYIDKSSEWSSTLLLIAVQNTLFIFWSILISFMPLFQLHCPVTNESCSALYCLNWLSRAMERSATWDSRAITLAVYTAWPMNSADGAGIHRGPFSIFHIDGRTIKSARRQAGTPCPAKELQSGPNTCACGCGPVHSIF
jgi:hypothetical protein